ncbi:uncharacterized protein LOC112348822 [Selaginella moellendorffii]|uniref:uncharacterized protein LOC112348822 n=1 Tax=Selaginella moellendorffii TaxID=88036 RepID=UPI000D1CF380|nr:uncharacterized protein LOC112348822 [Selaginella moellendorffii]|eukprot:XP_024537816.1 uncharacterized protein LOC112348822 [Selaginella moellendorffii]
MAESNEQVLRAATKDRQFGATKNESLIAIMKTISGVFQADEAALAALRSFSSGGVIAAHKQLYQDSAAMEAASKSQGTYRGCVSSYMDGLSSIPVPLVTSRSTLCKNVGLVDLEPGRPNPGSVLHGFLRVEAFRCSNVAVMAPEDDSGRMARLLALNSLFWNSSQEEVARIFHRARRFFLKNPCLVEAEFCQGLAVWVPNPLSLEIVSCFPRMEVGDPDVFIGWGSKELDERKNYLAAADLFTRCLECLQARGDETKMVVALVRRAEARIKLERYEGALADVEKALALDPRDLKGLAVQGAAVLGLKQYGLSSSCFKEVVEVEASPAYRSLYDASLRFREQSERGVYDLSLSLHYLAAGGGLGDDHAPELADFVGPVKVAMTQDGRGRGLFLTENVALGQLLLVSNAVAVVFPDEECPVLEADKFGTLLTAVLRACMASPKTLTQVYSLAESDPVTGLSIDKDNVPEMEFFQPNHTRARPQRAPPRRYSHCKHPSLRQREWRGRRRPSCCRRLRWPVDASRFHQPFVPSKCWCPLRWKGSFGGGCERSGGRDRARSIIWKCSRSLEPDEAGLHQSKLPVREVYSGRTIGRRAPGCEPEI